MKSIYNARRCMRDCLIDFMSEELGRVAKLGPALYAAVLQPPTGSVSIAQIGKEDNECCVLEFNQNKLKEIDRRRGEHWDNSSPGGPTDKGGCLPALWDRSIHPSIIEGKKSYYKICLGYIIHIWFNLFDEKNTWVGTLYFGPFIDDEKRYACNIDDLEAARTLPRVAEAEVDKLGGELADLFAPVMTQVLSPSPDSGWLLTWILCEKLVPGTLRERVWAPAFGHLVRDWIDRLYYPQKWIRFFFHVAFSFRTILLFLDVIVAMFGDRIGCVIREIFDIFRDFFRKH